VRVIGVRYPVHPEYAAAASASIKEVDEFLRANGVSQIVDLQNLFTTPTAFDDADHVKPSRADELLRSIGAATGVTLTTSPSPQGS
jgi:hypothetical protein